MRNTFCPLLNHWHPKLPSLFLIFHGQTSLLVQSGLSLPTNLDLVRSVSEMMIQKHSGSEYQFHSINMYLFSVVNTYSSDGPQPHFITAEFPGKVAIQVRELLYMS
jgi:hypothetical protein